MRKKGPQGVRRGRKAAAGSAAGSAAPDPGRTTPKYNFEILDPAASSIVKAHVSDEALVRQRRSQIVRTAIRLFARKGFHGTTVKDIAEEAGVSPGLIYQYVSDKDDLLFLSLQVIVHTINEVVPASMQGVENPVHRFVRAFAAYCRVVDANRDAVHLTYRETKSLSREHRDALKQMETETNAIIKECVETCIRDGLMRPVDPELFVYHVIMVVQAWALKYWRLSSISDLDTYIEVNLDLLLRSVLTDEGWSSYRATSGGTGAESAERRLRGARG